MQNENIFKIIKENLESAGLYGKNTIIKHLPPTAIKPESLKWANV